MFLLLSISFLGAQTPPTAEDTVAKAHMSIAPLSFLNVFFFAELIFMVWLLGWGWRIQELTLA
jgi:hypothetical protein